MNRTPEAEHGERWNVTFAADRCSLCEICVQRCPVGALTIDRRDLVEDILFHEALCHGCHGEPVCRTECPEHAVTVEPSPVAAGCAGTVVLVTGELRRCASCGKVFAPERKLAMLLKKGVITAKPVQAYCPDCRRGQLLDRYMSMLEETDPTQ